jgi:hypothetical protein
VKKGSLLGKVSFDNGIELKRLSFLFKDYLRSVLNSWRLEEWDGILYATYFQREIEFTLSFF